MPGNRAHVDLLFQKFDEDANIDFDSLDIAVNAVATAVKDFFFKVGQQLSTICCFVMFATLLKNMQKTATPQYDFLFGHVCNSTEDYEVV